MKTKNRLKEKLRPYPDDCLEIANIRIGRRHRKDHGDLQVLADSIALVGLLQPIGITEDRELVFGERRLLACRDILEWSEIPARIINLRSIVEGEFHENEVRKDFTPSERVAIGQTIERQVGERRGGDTSSGKQRNPQNLAECKGRETRDLAAERSGFGNRETYRQARKVTEHGTPELVDAMDRGEISVSAAADLASEPHEEQRERLALPSKKEALKQAKATGAAVLARDGKYYGHVEPGREARIGDKIDLDLDTPEELERKADRRQQAEPTPKVERRKGGKPAPCVAIEDPTQPAEPPAAGIDRLMEDLWGAFAAIGRAHQLRFLHDACLRLGLDPLKMAPPAAFGVADEDVELAVDLPAEVPPATEDAPVGAQGEQRDDAADGGTDLQDAGDEVAEAADQQNLGAGELQDGDHAGSEAAPQAPGEATKCAYCQNGFTRSDPPVMLDGQFYHRIFCLEDVKPTAITPE